LKNHNFIKVYHDSEALSRQNIYRSQGLKTFLQPLVLYLEKANYHMLYLNQRGFEG